MELDRSDSGYNALMVAVGETVEFLDGDILERNVCLVENGFEFAQQRAGEPGLDEKAVDLSARVDGLDHRSDSADQLLLVLGLRLALRTVGFVERLEVAALSVVVERLSVVVERFSVVGTMSVFAIRSFFHL